MVAEKGPLISTIRLCLKTNNNKGKVIVCTIADISFLFHALSHHGLCSHTCKKRKKKDNRPVRSSSKNMYDLLV